MQETTTKQITNCLTKTLLDWKLIPKATVDWLYSLVGHFLLYAFCSDFFRNLGILWLLYFAAVVLWSLCCYTYHFKICKNGGYFVLFWATVYVLVAGLTKEYPACSIFLWPSCIFLWYYAISDRIGCL